MTFEPLRNLLFQAADRQNLGRQAEASFVCERVKKIIEEHFTSAADFWIPKKYQDKTLTIQARGNIAANELYMRKAKLLKALHTDEELKVIADIKIVN